MDRREFVLKTCVLCAGSAFLTSALSSCQSTYFVNGTLESNGISVLSSEFNYLKKDVPASRQYILVHHDKLEFPIYLFRFSASEYAAVLMRCTHQGSELQASGDHLYCSSHGSEFDNTGKVTQGPAEKNLRSFPVTVQGDKIFIDLSQS